MSKKSTDSKEISAAEKEIISSEQKRMINKNLVGIKRYRFFETEKPQKLSDESGLNFTLNDMIPFSFKIYDNYYYVIGKLKKDEKTNNEKLFRIFKVHPCGKIINQYIPYTDSILDFTIIQIPDGKAYLILLGTDFGMK